MRALVSSVIVLASVLSSHAFEVESVYDAWAWYEIGNGAPAEGGYAVERSIKRHYTYRQKVDKYILSDVEDALKNVNRRVNSGRLGTQNARVLGLRDAGTILGSFALDARYTVKWTAGAWKKGKRSVNAEVFAGFSYNERWDFRENQQYSTFQNWMYEFLPRFLVGKGTPYNIRGYFTDSFSVTVSQRQ